MKDKFVEQILTHKSQDGFITFKIYDDGEFILQGDIKSIVEAYERISADSVDYDGKMQSKSIFTTETPTYSLELSLIMPNDVRKKILITSEIIRGNEIKIFSK